MSELIVRELRNRVLTLRMNNPPKLNAWTLGMQEALRDAFAEAATSDEVGAVVLTGTGEYYSAGADLSGQMRLMNPKALHELVVKGNYQLFDNFISFPKILIAAVNGHAIGAPVTSATLCDATFASDSASFRTPFARFGVPKEGCSSVVFDRLLGPETAERILGKEGWRPDAQEALKIGLIDEVVPSHQLLERAQAAAEAWIAEGRSRRFKANATREELKEVNARESVEVADAILSAPFLMRQYRFLKSKKKTGPAMTFLALRVTRPAWSLLL